MKKCTMLVNSCDAYSDTWYPLFKILNEEWQDRPYDIILNTESKKFDYGNMNIRTLSLFKEGEKDRWGKRLIETLKRIDTPYVLMYLDDFFVKSPVNQSFLDKCIENLDKNEDVAVFSLMPTRGENIADNRFEGFERRPQDGEYRLNCQAAIWRKDILIKLIRPHENPWQWEILGNPRSRFVKEGFYSLIDGYPPPFDYDLKGWTGLVRGKWVRTVVEPIFAKHGIEIDLEKRGVCDDPLSLINRKRSFTQKVYERILFELAKNFGL